jgi:hypothetical protein
MNKMGKKLKQALGKLKIYFIPKKIEKLPAKKIVKESNCQSLRQRTENPSCLLK